MNIKFFQTARTAFLIAAVAVFAGCQKREGSGSSGANGGGIVSAEKNSFDQVTSKLDKGGSLYVYLSTEQTLGNLSKSIANASNFVASLPNASGLGSDNIGRAFDAVTSLVKDSGVEKISGVGLSSIEREKDFYRNKIVVYHEEGADEGVLWSVFGKSPHALKELDMLPDTTAAAMYSDVDVPLVWETVLKEAKKLQMPEVETQLAQWPEEFQTQTGLKWDDVLHSLGGGFGVVLTLDDAKPVTLPVGTSPLQIPDPGLVIFARVKSDVIFDRVDKAMAGNPMITHSDTSDLKSRTAVIPIKLPVTVRPTIARSGDYLFIASTDHLVREMVAVKKGEKKGFTASAEFKKLSQGIPLEGNSFSLVTEKFGKTFSQAAQQMATTMGQGGDSDAQAAIMQNLQKSMASQTPAFGFSVGVNGPEGFEGFGNSSKSMTAMLLPAAAGMVGMVAAIAIPNFVKARNTALANAGNAQAGGPQYNAIMNNLRMIEGAKQQWALEQRKLGSSPVSMNDLAPYLGRGPQGGITPVAGEHYIIGIVSEKPKAILSRAVNGHPAGSEVMVGN